MSRTLPDLTHLAYPSQTPLNSLKWKPRLSDPPLQDAQGRIPSSGTETIGLAAGDLLDRLADFGRRKRSPPWRPGDSAHHGAIASTDPLVSNAPSAPQHTLSDGATTGGAGTTPTAPPTPSHLTLVVTETTCQNCGETTRQPGNAFLAFYSSTSASVNRDASDMERFRECADRRVSVRHMSVPFCEQCWMRQT